MSSAYEQERERNMKANEEHLKHLGLDAVSRVPAVKRVKRTKIVLQQQRKSPRVLLSGECSGAPISTSLQRFTPWEEEMFRQVEAARPASFDVWDSRRTHQHLTISPTGCAVATTGVAGYGAALCAKRNHSSTLALSWEVRAVRFGVGGFGVGAVRSAMQRPYKSIGKSADAIGVYLSSGALAVHGVEREFGPPYEEGDRIGVVIRPSGGGVDANARGSNTHSGHTVGRKCELAFLLNGREVGVAATALDGQAVTMAVQPYMGGVALLTS